MKALESPGKTKAYLIDHEFAREFDQVKNGSLKLKDITMMSNRKVWWLCKLGHSWDAIVYNRTTRDTGCPYCSGRRVLKGFNDLATTHPEVSEQWHPTRNKVSIDTISFGKRGNFWWLDKNCDHEWCGPLISRSRGSACPYCSGKRVLAGFNDLESQRPLIAKLWSKRNKVSPNAIGVGSAEKVWWTCGKGHEWHNRVWLVVRSEGKCLECDGSGSNLERAVKDSIKSFYTGEIIERSRPIKNDKSYLEIDLLLPQLKLGFEIQDFATHSRLSDNEECTGLFLNLLQNKGKSILKRGPTYHEKKKSLALEQLGVTIVEIWEDEIKDRSFESKIKTLIHYSLDNHASL